MKRFTIIFCLFFGLVKVSVGSCAGDDRTLTEMLFRGNPGTIFTCEVLTFSTPKYPDGLQVSSSDGSIDGAATAEIVEVYFGKVDTNIVTLRAGSFLTIGKTYLIYTSGSGRVFDFGGNCDRWTKQVTDNATTANELLILKRFSGIFKNKVSGQFTFTNSKNVVLAEGAFKKGKPNKIWKHYYDNGTIKAAFDLNKNVTVQYSANGFIKGRSTIKNNVGIYEQYSSKVNGQLQYKDIETKNDTGLVMRTFQYFDNGQLQKIQCQIVINEGNNGGSYSGGLIDIYEEYNENGKLELHGQYEYNRRVGLWKWYDESGKIKTQFDYKDGTGNQ